MENQKGIALIYLILIIVIIIGAIIFIITNNQGKVTTNIKWDTIPSVEYYELRLAATQSEVSGNGIGKLSKTSFNTLGKAVKKANGKWFKSSNVNFKAQILDADDTESVTLTDGEYVAIFRFKNGDNVVSYKFWNKDDIEAFRMEKFNLLGGYRITIK